MFLVLSVVVLGYGWKRLDFDNFFTKPPPPAKPQSRVQLTGKSMNLPVPQILSVQTSVGRCLIDTCSDVSVSRRDVLYDVHRVLGPVVVGHMGGESLLYEAGSLQLEGADGSPPVILSDVFVVQPETLPASIVALLGNYQLTTSTKYRTKLLREYTIYYHVSSRP